MRAVALVSATLLLATVCTPAVASAHEHERKEPVIVVTGEGDAAVAPDLAIVSLGVAETRKTAREALDVANAAMTDVIDALKKQGIAPRDLQTLARSVVLRLLRGIREGRLTVLEPGGARHVFGSGPPHATVEVRSPAVWPALLHGSRGLAESYRDESRGHPRQQVIA